MKPLREQLSDILSKRESAALQVFTLGSFRVMRKNTAISSKEWGRDTAIQLFQFLITTRDRRALHKEQIIDRVFPEADIKTGERTFKVALHGTNKALEPNRPSRTEPRFIHRQGITYQLNLSEIWIDADAIENLISIGNQSLSIDDLLAEEAYREAIDLHHGIYLPNRIYEDWSADERERLQVLILGAIITLAELLVEKNPLESIRLSQKALKIDAAWEDAYRVQMRAYLNKGNRPMAIKSYQNCVKVLKNEFGVSPLPETQKIFREMMG